jgi:glycyl-tRNA synthetase
MLVCLIDAYHEEEVKGEKRVVLRLDPKIAPFKTSILPLVNRDNMPEIAQKIAKMLRPHFPIFYDDKGAVGRRYRRQDEAGTPFGITVDSQTLDDETVTLRERDSMEQSRHKIDDLVRVLDQRIWGDKN